MTFQAGCAILGVILTDQKTKTNKFAQQKGCNGEKIMAIDISKMRNKLSTLKGKGGQLAKFWKPQAGTQTVRILPTEDGDPFKSYFFHYGLNNESVLCPKHNFGEECAVCDFVAKLYNDGDEESREMAKKLVRKQRFFSPVLVRGEENEGARVWGYSKTVYQTLLETVLNPDYGDITDPETGVDIDLRYEKTAGKMYPETTLAFKRNSSPMCSGLSDEECSSILESVPDFDKLHKRRTSEEVQTLLDGFLSGDGEDKQETEKYGSAPASNVDDVLNSLMD